MYSPALITHGDAESRIVWKRKGIRGNVITVLKLGGYGEFIPRACPSRPTTRMMIESLRPVNKIAHSSFSFRDSWQLDITCNSN